MEVWERHEELYHYTDKPGVHGILDSQMLFATHFSGMNDSSEVEHFAPVLEEKLYRIVNSIMRRDAHASLKYRQYLSRNGGLYRASREETRRVVKIFYDITFRGRETRGAFGAPFLTSFCSHTDSDEYTRNNGLLSQWRGYGDKGGYAIVFDCRALVELLEAETKQYNYAAFHFGDVVYDDVSDAKFDEEFPDLIPRLEEFVEARARGDHGDPGSVFSPLFGAASRFKHRGFKEEREVRLTAAPTPAHVFQTGREKGIPVERELKPVMERQKLNRTLPYIRLNDVRDQRPLPIKRIIVGPQLSQADELSALINRLRGTRIRVSASDTPFIPG